MSRVFRPPNTCLTFILEHVFLSTELQEFNSRQLKKKKTNETGFSSFCNSYLMTFIPGIRYTMLEQALNW